MPDKLRSLRIVHNRLASPLLSRLMHFRDWTELKLAVLSGLLPRVISAHLCGNRAIRPQNLTAYLRVLDRQERIAFLDAWLRDNMDYEVIAILLDGTEAHSISSAQENQYRMLDWWATAIARDSKFAKIFTRFSTKADSLVAKTRRDREERPQRICSSNWCRASAGVQTKAPRAAAKLNRNTR
jgi:hypothetical protein